VLTCTSGPVECDAVSALSVFWRRDYAFERLSTSEVKGQGHSVAKCTFPGDLRPSVRCPSGGSIETPLLYTALDILPATFQDVFTSIRIIHFTIVNDTYGNYKCQCQRNRQTKLKYRDKI